MKKLINNKTMNIIQTSEPLKHQISIETERITKESLALDRVLSSEDKFIKAISYIFNKNPELFRSDYKGDLLILNLVKSKS